MYVTKGDGERKGKKEEIAPLLILVISNGRAAMGYCHLNIYYMDKCNHIIKLYRKGTEEAL